MLLLFLNQFLWFCRVHSLAILSNRVCEWFIFWILACLKCLYLFPTWIFSLQVYVHKLFPSEFSKDLALLSAPINHCSWEVWDRCDNVCFFFSLVYNLLFSWEDLELSLCPWYSKISQWCDCYVCSTFHFSCLGLFGHFCSKYSHI